MTITNLLAALEERLFFYSALMETMDEAIQEENPEHLDYLSGLENETARIILSLEKSLELLGKTADPDTAGEDIYLLRERVERARTSAMDAAGRNKDLLEKHLEDIRARMEHARKKRRPRSAPPPAPAFFDLQA